MIKIAPSILAADFAFMGNSVREAEKNGADMLHLDVMDGIFVPNITFGTDMIRAVKRNTGLPLDVHLMIDAPERFAEEFAKAGADIITVHYEATKHPHRTLSYISSLGVKSGIAYNPGTDISSLEYLADEADLVLLMSVNPGFGGQKFIPSTLSKLEKAKRIIGDRDIMLEVDGGINSANTHLVKEKGANVLVAGSSVFSAKDMAKAIEDIRNL